MHGSNLIPRWSDFFYCATVFFPFPFWKDQWKTMRLNNFQQNPILGGGFKDFWNFHPDPRGDDPIWRAYFSNGLVKNHQLALFPLKNWEDKRLRTEIWYSALQFHLYLGMKNHLSSVQNLGWLFDIGDYTTQFHGDYTKPIQPSL